MVEWTTIPIPRDEKDALDELKPEDMPYYKHYRKLMDEEGTEVGELTLTAEDMRPVVREEIENALSGYENGSVGDIDVPDGISANEVREIVRDEVRSVIRDELR